MWVEDNAQRQLAHSRWIFERFYQDARGEVGLDDYGGELSFDPTVPRTTAGVYLSTDGASEPPQTTS